MFEVLVSSLRYVALGYIQNLTTGAGVTFNPVFLFMITPIHLIFDFGIHGADLL